MKDCQSFLKNNKTNDNDNHVKVVLDMNPWDVVLFSKNFERNSSFKRKSNSNNFKLWKYSIDKDPTQF